HAHMSKRGSPYLRRAVWMASIVAVQRDPMFRAYYDKKAALYSFGEYPISALKHFVK
ncbi:MAG: IS110 family transposase, partial [Acutalibacter sp.]|nr:IS110 family transposase [Acutalibacter sp.]